jgi:hypothetical protein
MMLSSRSNKISPHCYKDEDDSSVASSNSSVSSLGSMLQIPPAFLLKSNKSSHGTGNKNASTSKILCGTNNNNNNKVPSSALPPGGRCREEAKVDRLVLLAKQYQSSLLLPPCADHRPFPPPPLNNASTSALAHSMSTRLPASYNASTQKKVAPPPRPKPVFRAKNMWVSSAVIAGSSAVVVGSFSDPLSIIEEEARASSGVTCPFSSSTCTPARSVVEMGRPTPCSLTLPYKKVPDDHRLAAATAY